ncbi:uncharacterized protein LOC128230628 [Mya arenaria]|uniref:uncharacterized protein LOC128230628 n=1 Tax=Mya arenaria TaxID=6604 RepID=UPI0022E7F13A|nr:uncharacterized protein LOC128230628 [Mya arenaria]
MSESETQRTYLVGVNQNGRSLKFLNNKNNMAAESLRKQLAAYERQKTITMSNMESRRLNTELFLKRVRYLEHEEDERLMKKHDDDEEETPDVKPRVKQKRQRQHRMPRMAQTAPANVGQGGGRIGAADSKRKYLKSGPETQAEREHMLRRQGTGDSLSAVKLDRKESMFLQLSGRGRHISELVYPEIPSSKTPRPNPRTLLDVMIGLNAMHYLPTSNTSEQFNDSFRGDSRLSIDHDSMYSSNENTAKRFMNQWKSQVAFRKGSIVRRIDKAFNRNVSTTNLTSVAEDPSRLRTSRMMLRQSMQMRLPAIDDDERKETFLAWMQEEKEKAVHDPYPFLNDRNNVRQAQRRRSFVEWLDKRTKFNPKTAKENEDRMAPIYSLSDDEDEDDEPQNLGDLMRTLLKVKMAFRDPLNDRIRRFYSEVDEMVRRDETAARRPIGEELQRRWKRILQGVDAGHADSGDEDYYLML